MELNKIEWEICDHISHNCLDYNCDTDELLSEISKMVGILEANHSEDFLKEEE